MASGWKDSSKQKEQQEAQVQSLVPYVPSALSWEKLLSTASYGPKQNKNKLKIQVYEPLYFCKFCTIQIKWEYNFATVFQCSVQGSPWSPPTQVTLAVIGVPRTVPSDAKNGARYWIKLAICEAGTLTAYIISLAENTIF